MVFSGVSELRVETVSASAMAGGYLCAGAPAMSQPAAVTTMAAMTAASWCAIQTLILGRMPVSSASASPFRNACLFRSVGVHWASSPLRPWFCRSGVCGLRRASEPAARRPTAGTRPGRAGTFRHQRATSAGRRRRPARRSWAEMPPSSMPRPSLGNPALRRRPAISGTVGPEREGAESPLRRRRTGSARPGAAVAQRADREPSVAMGKVDAGPGGRELGRDLAVPAEEDGVRLERAQRRTGCRRRNLLYRHEAGSAV